MSLLKKFENKLSRLLNLNIARQLNLDNCDGKKYPLGSLATFIIIFFLFLYGVTSTSKNALILVRINPKSSFYCELRPDTVRGGKVYMVMYHRDEKTSPKPWLKMVRSMGGGWSTQKRCGEIASRLEEFRKQGLVAFTYRPEPNTPKQYVLCAVMTKVIGSDGCPVVLTLLPEDDPKKELWEVAGALLQENKPVEQNSGNSTSNNPGDFSVDDPLTIHLKEQL